MSDIRFPDSGLIVAGDSGIASGKDLNGKTVGVATLRGLDQLCMAAMIDRLGGDSKSVQFVEISAAASTDALLLGRVAAVTLTTPQLQLALATNRVRNLGNFQAAIAPRWIGTEWFTTTDFLQKNGDGYAEIVEILP